MEGDQSCAICFGSMNEQCSIKTCGHQFCFGCISKWVETKTVCPLCNSKVEALVVTNSEGTREHKIDQQTNKLKESTLQEDLSCLDHSYFLDEVSRLFQAAESAEQQMKIKMATKNVTMGYRGVKTMNYVFEQLNDYQELFCSCEQFDPQSALEGLYALQGQINLVGNGEFHKLDYWEEEVKVQRYGADDVPDVWSDEDDEYGTYYSSKQKNKGKWEASSSWPPQTPPKTKVPTNFNNVGIQTSKVAPVPSNLTTTTSPSSVPTPTQSPNTIKSDDTSPVKNDVESTCDASDDNSTCTPEKSNQNLHSPTITHKGGVNGTKNQKGKKKGKEFIFEPIFYAVSYTHLTLPTICSV
eukprot:TRINITY_DN1304_c0_g1_i1.p1 TRINITY_DN1304_c0_g1~~TRINITY_DN1304_c0_g1_i1.p1  ORF type:complete len:354 (-),score=86.45 TRINITY_DN1304_c0_g1_i1:14-1075(-)